MEYKGYTLIEDGAKLKIKNVRDFDADQILLCGQCFRWSKEDDGSFTGVVKDKVISLNFSGDTLELEPCSIQDFQALWFDYFDLGTDYAKIKESLAKDDFMREAIRYGSGIRILRQEVWETLVSFILSANNNVPRIMKIVAALSKLYGEHRIHKGKDYYLFPDCDRISSVPVEELEVCRGGYRCQYIVNSAKTICSGQVKITDLQSKKTEEAGKQLMLLPGVGPKVADCILLYSGIKFDVFPTDVWVKRVMEELYFKREASIKEIWNFSREYFGDLAGFAQQYLFFYARENKIGT